MAKTKRLIALAVLAVLAMALSFSLVACKLKVAYAVKFYGEEGQIGATQYVAEGDEMVVPEAPEKFGYEFLGWTYEGQIYDFTAAGATIVTKSVNFYAKYSKLPDKFIVKFLFEDGTAVIDDQIVAIGDEVVLPEDPTSEEGVFEGWKEYGKNDLYDFSNKYIRKDATFIAVFGHDYGKWTVKTPAGCETKGEEIRVCRYNAEHTETRDISAKGHSPAKAVVENLVEATCEADGSYDEVVYCSTCNEELSRTQKTLDKLGHDIVYHDKKEATCTEKGHEAYETCTRCDYTTYVEIPAKGHTPATTVIENHIEATCEADGSYDEVVYCSVCNEELSRTQKTIDKLGHTWGDWTVTKEATCTEKGEETRTCSRDAKHIETREIPAKGHDIVYHDKKDATCTENGHEAYDTCTRCDYTTYVEIPAKGHSPATAVVENRVEPTCETNGSYDEVIYCSVCNEGLSRTQKTIDKLGHTWGDWTVTKEATCTEKGEETSTCSRDAKHIETREIPAKGHAEVVDSAVEATCTKTGLTEGKHCSVCNEVLVAQTVVSAKGHSEVIDGAVEATCTETGLTEGKHCSVCNEVLVKQTVVSAKGHTPATTVIENRTEATCEADGSYDEVVYCSVCNEELSRTQKTIDKLGHTWGDWTVTKEATCTEKGEETRTCSRDAKHIEAREIPAKGHAEVIDSAVEATCTKTGLTEGKHCSVCNEVLVEQNETPMSEHAYDETGTCKNCGALEPGSLSSPYTVSEALEAGESLGDNETSKVIIYVKGFVIDAGTINGENAYVKNAYIVENLSDTNSLLVYTCSLTESVPAIYKNDFVLIKGYLKKYKGTLEIASSGSKYAMFVEKTVGTSSITVAEDSSKQATVTLSETEAKNESTFTFTVSVADGYEIDTVTVNGEAVVATEGGYYEGVVKGDTVVSVQTKEISTVKYEDYTLDFSIGDNRTAYSTTEQKWEANGITFINKKGTSTTNIRDSVSSGDSNIRIYANSNITVNCSGMTKIVFNCTSDSYATSLQLSITSSDDVTVAVSGKVVTVTFASSVDTFEISKISAQTRLNSIVVTAVSHNWDNGTIIKQPTCTETGEKLYKCTDEGCTQERTETIPTLDHTWDDGVVTAEATCSKEGVKTFTCTKCNETKTEVIAKADHDFSTEWTCDNAQHWHKCKNCDAVQESSKANHTDGDSDNLCDVCGQGMPTGETTVEKTYTFKFTESKFKTNDSTVALGDVSWTLAGDGGYWGYSGGQQFGSGNKPYTSLTLTSDSFKKVKKIIINTKGGSSVKATFTVTVGGKQVGEATTLTTTATDYTFEPIALLDGSVEFKYTQTSKKAIYISSITVVYEE